MSAQDGRVQRNTRAAGQAKTYASISLAHGGPLWLLAEAFASSPLFEDDPKPQLLRDVYNAIAG